MNTKVSLISIFAMTVIVTSSHDHQNNKVIPQIFFEGRALKRQSSHTRLRPQHRNFGMNALKVKC